MKNPLRHEKKGKGDQKIIFPQFSFVLQETNGAHMQNFIEIAQKMKAGTPTCN